MKINNAGPGLSMKMDEKELLNFLSVSKINLHLGTIDEKGHPNIHPVWYNLDRKVEKIYFNTSKKSKKFINLSKNPVVYFCVDDNNIPYKGVRGKGSVSILENLNESQLIAESILLKYLTDLDHPMAIMILESVKNGESAIIEITPDYYSTWDDSKVKW